MGTAQKRETIQVLWVINDDLEGVFLLCVMIDAPFWLMHQMCSSNILMTRLHYSTFTKVISETNISQVFSNIFLPLSPPPTFPTSLEKLKGV